MTGHASYGDFEENYFWREEDWKVPVIYTIPLQTDPFFCRQ